MLSLLIPEIPTDGGALGDEIARTAARLDATIHHLLTCIRAFDQSGAWERQGALSCAHWLTWRISLDPVTARERVRVARALGQLPHIDEALSRGQLSYAKVRALTRVATPENEQRLLELAQHSTGAQLERLCRKVRQVINHDLTTADRLDDRRFLREESLENGMIRLTAVLHPDEAALVMKALESARTPPAPPASAEGAPGKAWVRRTPCEDMTETLQRNPAGRSRPAKAGDQPEPSVAWYGGDPVCEAYTGSVRAV